MSQESKLSYILRTNALKNTTNHNSIKQYKRGIAEFCQWSKDTNNIKYPSQIDNVINYIQEYEKHLETKYTSAATIKAKLAPVTKGFGITLKDIEKPKIRTSDITRGRSIESANRNKTIANDTRFTDLDRFAKISGIRRDEIAKLKKCDLVKDESGYLCIRVRKGKGGKLQLQRLLPQYEKEIIKFFDYQSGEPIFKKETMNNKLNIHLYRAELAKEAYDYFKDKAQDTNERIKMRRELIKRFDKYHRPNKKRKRKISPRNANSGKRHI